jgi:hypothetical protein
MFWNWMENANFLTKNDSKWTENTNFVTKNDLNELKMNEKRKFFAQKWFKWFEIKRKTLGLWPKIAQVNWKWKKNITFLPKTIRNDSKIQEIKHNLTPKIPKKNQPFHRTRLTKSGNWQQFPAVIYAHLLCIARCCVAERFAGPDLQDVGFPESKKRLKM